MIWSETCASESLFRPAPPAQPPFKGILWVVGAQRSLGGAGRHRLSETRFRIRQSALHAEAEGQTWDLIILDPPSFTRSKKTLGDALRGYKEIHLRALKLLSAGGIISTYCCSHHVSQADFRRVICEAAVDAKRTLRQISYHTQRPDHPIVPTLQETEYLKGWTYEVAAAF